MPDTTPPRIKSHFAGPGRYRVEIEGRLSTQLSGRFGEFCIVSSPAKSGPLMTVLEGRVSDQASLAGVLNTLYELHLPLLSLQRLADESE